MNFFILCDSINNDSSIIDSNGLVASITLCNRDDPSGKIFELNCTIDSKEYVSEK